MDNKRVLKNIILIVLLVLSITSMILTVYLAEKNINRVYTKVIEEDNNKPDMPPGEKPTDSFEKNENDNSFIPSSEKAPSMGSDALEEEEEERTPPEKPESQEKTTSEETNAEEKESPELTTGYYIAFIIESLIFSCSIIYLILSKMNEKSLAETFVNSDKIIICLLATIILTAILTTINIVITNHFIADNIEEKNMVMSTNNKDEDTSKKEDTNKPDNNVADVETNGALVVTNEQSITGNYSSSNSDESAILVKDGGNATITDVNITKSGDATDIEKTDFYGINAAILVQKGSTATIKNTNITTSSKGNNAIFSTGTDSKIYISDSIIETTGSNSSRGLDATYGGYIEADNVTITTKGDSCATLATDRGEGTVKVKNSKLSTNGKGSPIIYSTGNISIDSTTGTSNGSQLVVVEGKNSATVNNSNLIASGIGNRNNVDKAGVMIYQSMSGDADEGKGTFTSTNSTLTISNKSEVYKTAPMFFITNTTAEINLTNTKISYGSNVLLSIAGTEEWGNKGSNGGNVTLNTNNQTMSGKIILDDISTLTMNLVKTSYKGAINSSNIAKDVKLKLDKDSIITLTGDTYVTSLENEDTTNSNIELNDFKLYVNGVAINQK